MKVSRKVLTNVLSELVKEELGPKSDIQYINPDQATDLIYKTNGSIFDVSFVKKDGSLRRMNARLGVKKYLKGGTLKFDAKERGFIVVYDIQCGLRAKSEDDKACYRMINKNTIKSLRIGKNKYIIKVDATPVV